MLGKLMVFYNALNNFSAISLDHLSVSSPHTRASNEKKFMSLPVRTDVFKHSFFFLRPLPIGIPFYWLFVSCSWLSPSTGLCWTRHPPTVADHHDTSCLHTLLDISPKNRKINLKSKGLGVSVKVANRLYLALTLTPEP